MRVVVFSHTSGLAGAERAIAESIQALHSAGHEVFIILPDIGPFFDHVQPYIAGHAVIYQDHWTGTADLTAWQKIKFLRGYVRSAKGIRDYLRHVQADLAITSTSVIIAGALGAAWASIPHVWYIHEFVTEDHGLVWQYGERFSYRLIDRLSRIVIVNSQVVFAKLRRFVPVSKLRLVYYATLVDWDAPQPSELPTGPVLLLPGAISEGKNQAFVVRALAEKPLCDIGGRLIVIGAGPESEKERLRNLAAELDVSDRLEIRPFNADRHQVFASGRVLVVPSRAEAFGRVTVEGQKSGIPVLLSDAGSAHELVRDGETGLLFSLADPHSLAASAARLLQDNALYNHVRDTAMQEANNRFSLPAHWQQLNAALQAALQKHGS